MRLFGREFHMSEQENKVKQLTVMAPNVSSACNLPLVGTLRNYVQNINKSCALKQNAGRLGRIVRKTQRNIIHCSSRCRDTKAKRKLPSNNLLPFHLHYPPYILHIYLKRQKE